MNRVATYMDVQVSLQEDERTLGCVAWSGIAGHLAVLFFAFRESSTLISTVAEAAPAYTPITGG